MTSHPARSITISKQGGIRHHEVHLDRHGVRRLLPGDPLDEQIRSDLPRSPLPASPVPTRVAAVF
ncbi:hypothetical protein NLM24_36130, partial [Nocardia zapadnayensis]